MVDTRGGQTTQSRRLRPGEAGLRHRRTDVGAAAAGARARTVGGEPPSPNTKGVRGLRPRPFPAHAAYLKLAAKAQLSPPGQPLASLQSSPTPISTARHRA